MCVGVVLLLLLQVWLALEEKGIPYDCVLIELYNKPAWYKELVPTSLVPAVVRKKCGDPAAGAAVAAAASSRGETIIIVIIITVWPACSSSSCCQFKGGNPNNNSNNNKINITQICIE